MAYPAYLKHSSSFLVKISIVAVLSVGFSTQAMAAPSVAPSCSGDACSDINAKFTGACYHVKNTGSKKVKVKWGKYRLTLYGGQADTMKYPLGGCVKSITGSLSANYSSSPIDLK